MREDVKYSFQRSALNAYHTLRSRYRRLYVLGVYSRSVFQIKCDRLFAALGKREAAIKREFAKPHIEHIMPKGLPSGTYNVRVTDFQSRKGVLKITYALVEE